MESNILIVNLLLTMLTIGVSMLVLMVWAPAFRGRQKLGAHDLLLIGIFIGFLSCLFDNVFWGVTWFSRLQKWASSEQWFAAGPWSNLIFRHLGKIIAGVCHLEAARRANVIESQALWQSLVLLVVCSIGIFLALMI